MAELHQLTATELAALVRSGKATSREVVDAHLARIAAVNGRANAVTVVLGDAARAAADEADRRRRKGLPLGPLDGVPFTVKENLDCQGSATTHGVPALRDALPYVDAPIVARMRGAGAIPIGRGNLSEMGLRLCTENPLRGRTQNPRSPRATSGGSSGGDAVAVATGMAPIGLGTDIGGSLRVPRIVRGSSRSSPRPGASRTRRRSRPRTTGWRRKRCWRRGRSRDRSRISRSACRCSPGAIGATRARSTCRSSGRDSLRRIAASRW